MLEVQKYLYKGNKLEDLEREYHIKTKVRNGKVSFNYDQVFSPEGELICQQCRGLILKEGTWEILAYPFNRFFNYGQGFCANIDWKSAKVLEKIDGSLIILYFSSFENKWCFASRKMVDAHGTCESGQTYSEIVEEALKNMGIDFVKMQNKLNKNYTYMFELVSPYTQVYIYYPQAALYLLGVRDNISLQELDPKPISDYLGISTPKEYPIADIKTLVLLVNTWKGDEQEGIVVVDKYFNRIKVKNKDYVARQGLVFSLSCSNRNIIQVIMNESDDDILPHCTDSIKEKLLMFKEKFVSIVRSIEKDWEEIKHIDNQKEYALVAKTKPWSGILFDLKKGKISSVETYMKKNVRVDYVLKLCGLDKIEEPKEIDI